MTRWVPENDNPCPSEATQATDRADRLLLVEEPLSLRIDGRPYAVVMRTPGLEQAHACGFALSEGLIDSRDDIATVAYRQGDQTNEVAITLTPARRERVAHLLDRSGLFSWSSSGLSGQTMVEKMDRDIPPRGPGRPIDRATAIDRLANLHLLQPLRSATRASHAAALYSPEFELIAVAEDVGRHNALDKAIGLALVKDALDRARIVVLSSRVSYEMIHKAARAGAEVILALSKPTQLAVAVGRRLNIAVASLAGKTDLDIYCGEERFAPAKS